jgi:hypothetical protein
MDCLLVKKRSIRTLQSIVVMLFCAMMTTDVTAATRHAFVVGVNTYDNLAPDKQLAKAVNDARAVGETLTGLGFTVSRQEDLKRAELNKAWQSFLARVQPGDMVAVFFSGHGVQVGGINYLLPRDVPKLGSGEDGLLRGESLSLQQMLDDLKQRSPGLSLVIIDACRENPFPLPGGKSIGGTRGLAHIDPPKGTFVLYSAGAGELALDRLPGKDPAKTSVFTRSLLPLLKTPGLKLQDVAVQTREAVRKLAASVPHEQNPAYYDGISGPPACLAGCRDLAVEQSEAAREWKSVDRNSWVGLQSFIERHPGTAEAAIAKALLADLRSASIPLPQQAPKPPKATQSAIDSESDKPGSVKPVVRCGFNEKLITGKCVAKPKKCDPDENLVNGKCVPKVISQPNVQGPIGSSPRTSVTNGYSNVNREACVKRCDGWSPTNRWKCVAFECK